MLCDASLADPQSPVVTPHEPSRVDSTPAVPSRAFESPSTVPSFNPPGRHSRPAWAMARAKQNAQPSMGSTTSVELRPRGRIRSEKEKKTYACGLVGRPVAFPAPPMGWRPAVMNQRSNCSACCGTLLGGTFFLNFHFASSYHLILPNTQKPCSIPVQPKMKTEWGKMSK